MKTTRLMRGFALKSNPFLTTSWLARTASFPVTP